MIRNIYTRLAIILIIMALALWIDLSETITITNPFNNNTIFSQSVATRLGLDLRGGLQVLLEADLPQDTPVDSESMETARTIMENRTNALGVSENVLQIAGDRRIVGEFPGLENTDEVLGIIQQTGLLEFVDTGDTQPARRHDRPNRLRDRQRNARTHGRREPAHHLPYDHDRQRPAPGAGNPGPAWTICDPV